MKQQIHLLSPEEARTIALHSQGLLQADFGRGKKAALQAIQHLGYVQIDTLAVVARAHHHTLWSRLTDYNEKYLNELLEKDKAIFEYWSHAASYLPMNDYRFSLPRKEAYAKGKSHWFGQDKKMKKYVLDRVRAEGPLQSKDFEYKREGPGNWYEWKPAKRALEQLFMEGKLMVAKRQGFQKVYDLTEKVLPPGINTTLPGIQEYAEHLIFKTVQSHGIVNETEITYLQSPMRASVKKALKKLLKEGQLMEVKIKGEIFLAVPGKIKSVAALKQDHSVHLLSPFDNLVIQRKRVQRIFGFDYMIECYLPEAKRKYGYFSLPVLYNNTFVARFDPKADRQSKIFYIRSMHFEKGFKQTEAFNKLFADRLKKFAQFNNCEKIVIEKTDARWKTEMQKLLC